MIPEKVWHAISADSSFEFLKSSNRGLTYQETRLRLLEFGPNTLKEAKRRSPAQLFLGQFADFMILVLLVATLVSILIGDWKDALAIMAIVFLNAIIGFFQEYRAERAMAALKAMAAPVAEVLRDGKTSVIPSRELVPGDLVLLEPGRIIPADMRLIELAHLKVEEAVLTGESIPVEKTTETIRETHLPLGERRNMAYKGTLVTYGRAKGLVVATGMNTEFGKIAALLEKADVTKTPLQKRLADFGRKISIAALAICAVIFGAGLLRGEDPFLIFMTAVSLAVAAIPEALPAVVTISLALGARRMVRKNALIRKLPSVETLGSVTYICTDKTGTLTENKMRVEEYYCGGEHGPIPKSGPPWQEFLRAMAISNDAHRDASGKVVGDPTEVALYLAAREGGFEKTEIERNYPRVAEIPFDSQRKSMTTIHQLPEGGFMSITKGAVEVVLLKSTRMLFHSGVSEIPSEDIMKLTERMASEAQRLIAVGIRKWSALPERISPEEIERDLTLAGFVGMRDPHRQEVPQAVEMCKTAGIVPVMITGDHPQTAKAIAKRIGILDSGEMISERELAQLTMDEFRERVTRIRVYARVSPEEKLKIIEALQSRGEIVAMTGDGVNDAPSLKRADIGVAMGIQGTDVAKEAAAMVLLDDNFATIVKAVREGRRIFDNMRKFIRYALTTNSVEIWTIFAAPFLGLPIPLIPIQILWINLLTDGLPGLALAAEREEKDIMHRPPRPPREGIFARGLGIHAIWVGIFMTGLVLGTQAWFLHSGSDRWQTMTFTVLCFTQLAHVMAIRSERESLLTQGIFSNRPLIFAVFFTILLQLAVIYLPVCQEIFRTRSLSFFELSEAIGISLLVWVAVECEKWIKRRRGAKIRFSNDAPVPG